MKKDCRHWENISWGILSVEVILLFLAVEVLITQQAPAAASPYHLPPTGSIYKTSLNFKIRKIFPLCYWKVKGTNTALLVLQIFFWKAPFLRTVFNLSQIYLWISRKHALCFGAAILEQVFCGFVFKFFLQLLNWILPWLCTCSFLFHHLHVRFLLTLIVTNTEAVCVYFCMHGNSP